LACTLASPCLDHEPKARVATSNDQGETLEDDNKQQRTKFIISLLACEVMKNVKILSHDGKHMRLNSQMSFFVRPNPNHYGVSNAN
jgi:hypothetical protein